MKKIYLLATAVIAVSLMGLDAKADCTPPAGTTICAETDLTVQAGHWKFSSESDPLTDGEILSIEVGSMEFLSPAIGHDAAPAYLQIWCGNNTTDVSIWFAGWFMASSGGYGKVDYRVDKGRALSVDMRSNTTNEYLALYGGKASIPFIKALFGGQKLLIRATPLNEAAIDVTFAISHLEEAIIPIRDACNW